MLETALDRGLVLLTGDLGFGSLLRTVPELPGVILVRLPDEWPTSRVNETIEKAVAPLLQKDLAGVLVVVEPDRVRLRRLSE